MPTVARSRGAAAAVGQTRRYQLDAGRLRPLGLGRVRIDARRDVELDAVVLERRIGEVGNSVGAHATGGLEVGGLIGTSDPLPKGLVTVLIRLRSGRQGSGRNVG